MANKEHVHVVKSESYVLINWRSDNPGVRLDLSKAKLNGLDLSTRNLSGANLREADLSGANLKMVKLTNANLYRADLSGVDMRNLPHLEKYRPSLVKANLKDAVLVGAWLQGVDMRGAQLQNADLRGADMTDAILGGADLSGAVYDGLTIWPKGFRPGLFVIRKLVVALDVDDTESPEFWDEAKPTGSVISEKNHLTQQLSELQNRYQTVSTRIAALDTDLGRALDSLSRQVLEEQRKEFADQREEIAALMARIEEQLGVDSLRT